MFNSNEIDNLLEQCLVRLGINEEAITNYKKIETGRSGATVIEVDMRNERFILKFTSCKADGDLYANAQSECRFYKQIRPLLNIQVPEILRLFEEGTFGIGILMRAYHHTPPSTNWSDDLIVKAITQIALLHAAFWNKNQEIERMVGIGLTDRFEHRLDEIEKSAEAWRHVYSVAVRTDSCPIALDTTLRLLGNISDLSLMESELPYTLVHGDFHMENCLLDESDRVIIADWQSPGMGSGPTDIGLFLARAELSGSDLSVDKLIDAYFTSLNDRLSKPIERSSLERIVHSKRLSTHLFWSPRLCVILARLCSYRILTGIVESSRKLGL